VSVVASFVVAFLEESLASNKILVFWSIRRARVNNERIFLVKLYSLILQSNSIQKLFCKSCDKQVQNCTFLTTLTVMFTIKLDVMLF